MPGVFELYDDLELVIDRLYQDTFLKQQLVICENNTTVYTLQLASSTVRQRVCS